MGQAANRTRPPDRRSFIGGSDARIIMGDDEPRPPPPLAGEARRSRTYRPIRRPICTARRRDRAPEPALVRAQYRAISEGGSAPDAPPGQPVDGSDARRDRGGYGRCIRSQVHAPVVVLGRGSGRKAHGAASAQYVGEQRGNGGAIDHNRRRQVGGDRHIS